MTHHERNARAGFALGVFIFAAGFLVLAGCEEDSAPPIVVQPEQVAIPADCPLAEWSDSLGKCRETATGMAIIAECCGRKP